MENPAKHLVYRPTTMQLLSILTTTVEIMPKVRDGLCSNTSGTQFAKHAVPDVLCTQLLNACPR